MVLFYKIKKSLKTKTSDFGVKGNLDHNLKVLKNFL